MELFTYLMAKNDHNTSVKKDLFSYLLGKNQSGTYTDYSGTSLSINNTKKAKMKVNLLGNTSQTGTPTPDNPIPVNVVSGDNEVVVSGINVWDEEWEQGTLNASTGALITINTRIRSKNFIPVFSNTNYYYTIPSIASNCLVVYYDGNNNYISSVYVYSGNYLKTTPANCKYIKISPDATYGATYNNDICINVSDVNINGTYYPYTGASYPIHLGTYELCKIGTYQDKFIRNSGKNIINNTNLTYDYSNVNASQNTLTTISTGIRYSTSLTSGTPFVLFKLLDLTNLKGKTIRMKANFSSGQIRIVRTNEDYSTRDLVTYSDTSGTAISYVVPSDLGSTPYLAYSLSLAATDSQSVDFTDLIMTIDNSDMTYEPYGNGDWYLEKYIGKVVLDGSENWGQNTGQTLTNTSFYFTSFIDSTLMISQPLKANYFLYTQIWNTDTQGIYSFSGGNDLRVRINTAIAGSVADFKTWLSTHNTSVYYVLATPTYTKIEGTLKDEVEAVWRANSYKGQTNISQINNDLPFELNVSVKVGS